MAALVHRAAEDLAAAAEVELTEVSPGWGPQGPELGRFFWSAHLSRFAPQIETFGERMDPGFIACINAGRVPTMSEYQIMRGRKYRYVAEIHRFFESFDLLLTPAVSVPAFPLPLLQPEDRPRHEWDWMGWAEFSYPFNMAGNPAASIPCGFTGAGLPVGLQIVGRRHDDLAVFQASALHERARPWADRRPVLNARPA